MTRETKIGMAIATTFLSLVGLVVASKMRSPESAPESMVKVGPDHGKPATEESSAPPGTPQSGENGIRTAQGSEPAPLQPKEPLKVAPASTKENEPHPQQPNRIVTSDGLPPVVAEPLKLEPAGGPSSPNAQTPFPGLPQAQPNIVGGLPPAEPNPLIAAPMEQKQPKKFGAMPPTTDLLVNPAPSKIGELAEPAAIGLPQPNTPKGPLPKDPLPKDPLPKDLLPKDPLPKDLIPKDPFPKDPLPKDPLPKDPQPGKSNGLPGLPPANESVGSPFQLPPVPSNESVKKKNEPLTITPLPSPDTMKPKHDVKVGESGLPEKKGTEPMPPPLTSGAVTAPAPKGVSIGTIGTIGSTGGEIRVTSPVTPASPGQGAGGNVPLLGAGNSKLPKVISYEDSSHIIQAGDASFDDLSNKLYGTPAFGQALLEYNRRHPLATANVKQNPPVLQPNQRIFYPDRGQLEVQYKGLIKGGIAAPTVPTSTVKISAPTPLAGPGSVTGTNPPTADATTAYRLAQPQFIFDIARQQLGDGLLWPEILRLNPALRTDQPIPAGTELRLPKAR